MQPKHELTNIYILYTDPQLLFYECLITVMIGFLRTTTAQKIFLYYPPHPPPSHPCTGITVRGSHHRNSPTRCEQDLITWSITVRSCCFCFSSITSIVQELIASVLCKTLDFSILNAELRYLQCEKLGSVNDVKHYYRKYLFHGKLL